MPDEPSDKKAANLISQTGGGQLDFGGKRAMMMDIAGGLYALKKTMMADIGFFEKDFMFRAGQEGAKEFLTGLREPVIPADPAEAIDTMLGLYSLRGYGEFKVGHIDLEKKIVQITSSNTVEAWAFQTNSDLQREPICSYTSGVLAWICRMAFSRDNPQELEMRAVELDCVAEGKKECRFVVAPISELPKLVPRYELPHESISEHELRLNEEILLKNLELQSLNLSLERQVRKRTEELRRSEENYRSLVNLSPDPIVICEMGGRITSINEAGLRMLGYDPIDESQGMTLASLLEGKESEWDKLRWILEKEGSIHGLELDFVRRDGSRITGEVSARFAELVPGRCIEAVIRDITEKKVMEMQVLEAKAESEFLNDLLSHDIINYTFSALHFLENMYKSQHLSEEDRRSLSVIMKDVQGAFELSSSVRDLSRVKMMGEEEMTAQDLRTLVEGAIEDTKRMYTEKKPRISYPRMGDPVYIKGYPLVSRLFTNLLTNAVKFDSRPEPEIDISFDPVAENGIEYWRTSISDHGKGVPDAEKKNIFEKFHRLDTSAPGNGLGLFVVRFIAKACGGSVWAENRVSGDHTKGTNMVVLLQKADERMTPMTHKKYIEGVRH